MRILSVGQVCDLEHGGFANQMRLRLDDGREVVINTDENTVAQILNIAAAEMRGQPVADVEPTALPEADTESVFGGDMPDPGEALSAPPAVEPPIMGTIESELPRDKLGKEIRRPGPRGGHPNKKGRVPEHRTAESVPSRTVPHDEAGNPIVPQQQGTMSHRGKWAGDEDEDGTSI